MAGPAFDRSARPRPRHVRPCARAAMLSSRQARAALDGPQLCFRRSCSSRVLTVSGVGFRTPCVRCRQSRGCCVEGTLRQRARGSIEAVQSAVCVGVYVGVCVWSRARVCATGAGRRSARAGPALWPAPGPAFHAGSLFRVTPRTGAAFCSVTFKAPATRRVHKPPVAPTSSHPPRQLHIVLPQPTA